MLKRRSHLYVIQIWTSAHSLLIFIIIYECMSTIKSKLLSFLYLMYYYINFVGKLC